MPWCIVWNYATTSLVYLEQPPISWSKCSDCTNPNLPVERKNAPQAIIPEVFGHTSQKSVPEIMSDFRSARFQATKVTVPQRCCILTLHEDGSDLCFSSYFPPDPCLSSGASERDLVWSKFIQNNQWKAWTCSRSTSEKHHIKWIAFSPHWIVTLWIAEIYYYSELSQALRGVGGKDKVSICRQAKNHHAHWRNMSKTCAESRHVRNISAKMHPTHRM